MKDTNLKSAVILAGFITAIVIIVIAQVTNSISSRVPAVEQVEYKLILIDQDVIQVKEISTGTTVKCNPDSLVFVLEELNK